MVSRREWAWVAAAGGLVLLFANLPYLMAYAAPGERVFGGILFALPDGYSYLAKMREGWRGAWLFTLPYTAEPGPGAFIFTYYLFLGNLARWLGLSVDGMYHLARLAGGAACLPAAYHLIARFLADVPARRLAWAIFAGGSGLGWLAAPWLAQPPDWWIAESLPFLTLLSNAHFPLAWALLAWLLRSTLPGFPGTTRPGQLMLVALATTVLAQVQPLALLPAGAVLWAATAWQMGQRRALMWKDWLPAIVVAVCAAPWIGYAVWLTETHPVLQQWNAQNLTPSPAPWEAVIWGGLPLLLAGRGAWLAARRRAQPDMLLLIWLVVGVGLVYAPFALQRRLSLGLWLPLCVLAAQGWPTRWPAWAGLLGGLAGGLSNLVVLAALLSAALTRRPEVFLSSAEAEALAQLPAGALVLAAPETSLFIPARSDARVLYGHPFETVDAPRWKPAVEAFFAAGGPARFLDENGVDFVLYGPREAELGPRPDLPGWRAAFRRADVTVYARP